MVEIRKIRGATSEQVANVIKTGLKKSDFDAYVSVENPTAIKVSDVRLSDEHIKKHGYNIHNNRRGKILGWYDWVKFNNMINSELDRLSVSANASSMNGRFKIRQDKKAFTEDDWNDLAYQNVGSQMNPLYLKDAWVSENTPRTFINGKWKETSKLKKLNKVI